MKTVVFCGPSLDGLTLRTLTDAEIRPPVKRGDLAGCGEFDVILILDGEFWQTLSVTPKEILELIDRGKTVVGAASMGALRASELDGHGMIGVGWIYRRFARMPVRRDDDVALIYSPTSFQPFTVPMVNVEYWLERLRQDDRVGPREAGRIAAAARSIFFAERTHGALMRRLARTIGPERLDELLDGGDCLPDIKAQDAIEALNVLAAGLDLPCRVFPARHPTNEERRRRWPTQRPAAPEAAVA